MKIELILVSILATVSALNVTNLKTIVVEPKGLSPKLIQRRLTASVNESLSPPGGFPYGAGIISYHPNHEATFCGGSLISETWTLSAAHCVSGCERHILLLGAYNLYKEEEERLEIDFSSSDIVLHKDFDPETLDNDICLIKSPQKIKFTKFISPVKLPKYSEENVTFESAKVAVSGWGKLSDDDEKNVTSPRLYYLKTTVLERAKCKQLLGDAITDKGLCIDASEISTCRGDAGAPLALLNKDKTRTIVGISSWRVAMGCDRGYPSVFVRVPYYLRWIRKKTNIKINN